MVDASSNLTDSEAATLEGAVTLAAGWSFLLRFLRFEGVRCTAGSVTMRTNTQRTLVSGAVEMHHIIIHKQHRAAEKVALKLSRWYTC